MSTINNNEDRERQLLLVLQTLVKAARKNRGMITQDQLTKATEDLNLTEEQMQKVREYLLKNDIGIDEPLDFEARATEDDENYLEQYKEMVAALDQPSDDEMDAIKIQAMAGEAEAQKKLAEYMLPKVIDIARLYAGQGVYMEDLIGAGNEALVRGTKLLGPLDGPQEVEPDLAQRIMGAMEDLVAANLDDYSADDSAVQLANRVKEKADELSKDLRRKVTVEELAAEGDLTEDEILDAIRITGDNIDSIDHGQR